MYPVTYSMCQASVIILLRTPSVMEAQRDEERWQPQSRYRPRRVKEHWSLERREELIAGPLRESE